MRLVREFLATVPELARVLWVLPRVEIGRRRRGPAVLLPELRQRGCRARARDDLGRRRLRRAIHWVDVCCGANCYRRVLLETALDRGAAADPVALGFRARGPGLSGHAWIDGTEPTGPDYDFTVRI